MSQSGPPPLPGGGPPSGAAPRKPDAKKPPLGKRSYTLKLSFSMLMTTIIVSLIGISWIFLLGVMVGRGYNPDAKVAEFASRFSRGSSAPVKEPPNEVVKPEDLRFMSSLKNKADFSAHNATLPALPAHNATLPKSAAAGRSPAAGAEDASGGLSAGRPAAEPAAAPRPSMHDYVYQVATFRESDQADRLRERLEGAGLRTRLDKTPTKDGKGSFYKVQALLRGTDEDNQDLLAALEKLKLGLPLLRSKTPVKTKSGPGKGGPEKNGKDKR